MRLSWRWLTLLLLLTQQATSQSGVWLGVGFSAEREGIRVATLPYGSPAETAGIRIGDIIAAIDERPTLTEQQFRDIVSVHNAGDEVLVRVLRDSNPMDIRVRVER